MTSWAELSSSYRLREVQTSRDRRTRRHAAATMVSRLPSMAAAVADTTGPAYRRLPARLRARIEGQIENAVFAKDLARFDF